MSDWLPPIISYSNFNGDWDSFLLAVYECFKKDFLLDSNRRILTFDGQPLKLRRHPLVRDKEASFWHLISSGDIEDERLIDFDRCERITWAREVINNADSFEVKRFESERHSKINICLWLESEDYMVVLGKREGYALLLTAYVVAPHRRKSLQRDYEAYQERIKQT